MRRSIVATCAAGLLLAASATATLAAKPNHQACLGESVSAAAGSALGVFVSDIAQNSDRGVGDEVQATLAGVVADVDFPNTCN
jgi:uncharacterized protein (DUF2345 family)